MPLAKIKENIEIDYLYEKRDVSAPPVVFLNGSIFNHRQWMATYLPAFRNLTEEGYSYVLYDYQGIGKSSSRDKQFTLQGLVDELLGLLDYLKIDRAHLFGVSKGSMVGQIFTGLFPDRVVSLAGYGIVNLLGPKLEEEQHLFTERLEGLLILNDTLSERINTTNYKRVIRTIYIPKIFQKTYSELNLKEKIISWILGRRAFPLLTGTLIRTLELFFRYYAQDIEKEIEFDTS